MNYQLIKSSVRYDRIGVFVRRWGISYDSISWTVVKSTVEQVLIWPQTAFLLTIYFPFDATKWQRRITNIVITCRRKFPKGGRTPMGRITLMTSSAYLDNK